MLNGKGIEVSLISCRLNSPTTQNLLLCPVALQNLPSGLVGSCRAQLACPTSATVVVVFRIQHLLQKEPHYLLSLWDLLINLREETFELISTVGCLAAMIMMCRGNWLHAEPFIFDFCGFRLSLVRANDVKLDAKGHVVVEFYSDASF